jgi:hypothetical protein
MLYSIKLESDSRNIQSGNTAVNPGRKYFPTSEAILCLGAVALASCQAQSI